MDERPYTLTATDTEHGCDVTVTAADGHSIDMGGTPTKEVTLHIRRGELPRIGQRVVCCGMLIKVREVRYDGTGRAWVVDEDSRAQLPWPSDA